MIDERLRPLVERVWNYHRLDHELVRSDAILVLCSHDTRVAEYAAQLFLDSVGAAADFFRRPRRDHETPVHRAGG